MGNTANDLINQLKEETENFRPAPTIEADHTEVPPSTDNSQPPPGEHFEPLNDEQRKQLTDQPDPEFSPVKARSTADRWVKMFSSFLKMALPPLYRMTILEKEDVKKMEEFNQKHKGKTEKQMDDVLSSDQPMWPVVNRFDEYMKAVKEVPLDDDERDLIAEPLSELIYRYRAWRLSPGWMLVVALGLVMLPRLVKLIPDAKPAAK